MSKESKDTLADYRVAPARKIQCEAIDGYGAAPVGEALRYATAHRGKRVRDGLPVFYVQDGSAQPFTFPVSAFGACIAGGLVPMAEIADLLSDKDKATLAKLLGQTPSA